MHYTDLKFQEYCNKTSFYPPNEMAWGKSPNKKAEDRWMKTCESVYSLSNSLLSEMRQSYKDLMVCTVVNQEVLKQKYLAGMIGSFSAYFEFSFIFMKKNFNKDPDVKKYFEEVFSEYEEIHKGGFTLMQNSTVADQDCIDAYKEKYSTVMKTLKERYK